MFRRGFTLIELVVTIAVLAIALSIAIPNFSSWMRRIQIRNAAEAVLHGLQLARSEAVKRNGMISVTLTGNSGWTITDSGGATIQSRPDGEGSKIAFVSIVQPNSLAPFTISFNSLGRQTVPNQTVSLSISDVAGTECTASGPSGCLVVNIAVGGLIKMCNPASAAGTPQAC